MEVHAHTHTPRKKWNHYLWEFLMLFLAVFCGFLAEYQLEHRIEKEKEREFIISLVSDLKDDILSIKDQITNTEKGIILFDSLSHLIESPDSAKKNGEAIYYTSRMGIRQAPFVNNTRTIDQLKNSGGFRLIRRQETSGQIMKYYADYPQLRMIEEFFNKENTAFKEAASKIMNQAIYRKQNQADNSIIRITGNLSLLSYDAIQLNQLGFYAIQMNGSRKGMIQMLQNLERSAESLIKFLQQEYQLK